MTLDSCNKFLANFRITVRLGRRAVKLFLVAVVAVAGFSPGGEADEGRDLAVGLIMGEEAFAQSAFRICESSKALGPQERFEVLHRHVIPSHQPLRVEVEFTPTHPVPSEEASEKLSGQRVPAGGELISPALDLVDAAAELKQLDVLQAEVDAVDAESIAAKKNRSALRILILMKKQDIEAAVKELDLLSALCGIAQPLDEFHRASELLVIERCMNHPTCAEAVLPMLERMILLHRSEKKETSMWSRLVKSRQGVASAIAHSVPSSIDALKSQWQSASRVTNETRGMGLPDGQWLMRPGRADNVISHGDDFLYFASPLVGDYQIECDATDFNWMEARLFAAGKWVSPLYDLVHFEVGGLTSAPTRRSIEPRLTWFHDNLHLRMTVNDQHVRAFANGRELYSEPVVSGVDPWVGIRSGYHVDGSVFKVRVTGQASVPDTIDLTAMKSLDSWRPYFDQPAIPARWTKTPNGIAGTKDDDPAFAAVPAYLEEALYYHRPMFEDGTIEYEFLYQPNDASGRTQPMNAHPVLDRLCLLMNPQGVAVHWLTDGAVDRTALAPDNVRFVPEQQRANGQVPLKEGEWNKAALTVKGNLLQLALNGQLIFERLIEPTNQRRFGFFYYADQESLQVRNVRWTGDWPKTVPGISEQPLSSPDGEVLDADAGRLTSIFEHDFQTAGLKDEVITVIHGSPENNFASSSEGVRTVIDGESGYRNATLAPAIQIQGDFDLIVEYAQLENSPPVKGSSSIMLVALLENNTQDEAFVTRRHMNHSATDVPQIVQCATVIKSAEGEKRDYFVTKPMEEVSGRLRLSRRGGTMYFLTAEGDSENFRLRGTHGVARDPVQMNGIRLVTQIHGKGSTKVVWKRLSVHAEKIKREDSGEPDDRIVELNKQRERLPVHFVHDWVAEAPNEQLTYRWGDLRPWEKTDKGLSVHAEGDDNWTSSGITLLHAIEGDFDFQADFEVTKLAPPANGQSTGIFLQMDSSDDRKSQISAIVSWQDTRTFKMGSQVRRNGPNGKPVYESNGQFNVKRAERLRISRRGRIVTVIGQTDGSAVERIVSRYELHDEPISSAKILLHTGGADRSSDIIVRSIEVHAEAYAPGSLIRDRKEQQ